MSDYKYEPPHPGVFEWGKAFSPDEERKPVVAFGAWEWMRDYARHWRAEAERLAAKEKPDESGEPWDERCLRELSESVARLNEYPPAESGTK